MKKKKFNIRNVIFTIVIRYSYKNMLMFSHFLSNKYSKAIKVTEDILYSDVPSWTKTAVIRRN